MQQEFYDFNVDSGFCDKKRDKRDYLLNFKASNEQGVGIILSECRIQRNCGGPEKVQELMNCRLRVEI